MPTRYEMLSQTKVTEAKQFDGSAGSTTLPGISLIRADSMEVTNDPRMFADNVIMKRLGAFHVVAVCAVLVGKMACAQMLKMESTDYDGIRGNVRYVAFGAMAFCFLADLFVAIVITMQLFHMTRLVTAGSTGFEIAKSYYLNPNIVCLRHLAVRTFFATIPIFILSVGGTVYVALGGRMNLLHAAPVSFMLGFASIALMVISARMNSIFTERYQLAKAHEEPLMNHLKTQMPSNPAASFIA